MGSEWKTSSLKELSVQLIDCDHKTPKAVENGIPYIGIPQMDNGRIDFDAKPRLISEEDFVKWTKKANPTYGDIILSRRCNSGETVYVPKGAKFALGQNLVLLRPTGDRIYPEFLRWAVHGREWWNEVAKYLNPGAIFESLKCADIPKFKIKEPPKDEQIKIANILSSIADKIELNRQTNQTLEHMAQAIFKSWFVDFEPTRAKIAAKEEWAKRSMTAKAGASDDHIKASQAEAIFVERAAMAAISGRATDSTNDSDAGALAGLDQLNPEQIQQLKTTAALFPDALVDSELGEIPLGWEVKLNGDVMDVRDGTHDSPKQSEVGFPLVTSKHITSGVLDIKSAYLISKEDYESVNKRSKVNQGDILLTMIGTVGMSYLVMQSDVNFAIKNVALFRTSEHKELKNYFYLLLKSPLMKEYLDARMAGTTQKYLSLKTLRSIDMLMPTAALLDAFNNITNPLLDKVFAALEENEYLSSIRGSLLPKLLAGELKAT